MSEKRKTRSIAHEPSKRKSPSIRSEATLPVTIKKIAEIAGVSRGTVDRVLHGRAGVNPDVAEHVRKIADSLGYEPNRAGKILAARKQPLKIGCFLPGVGNVFFDEVIGGFQRAAAEFRDFGVSVEISSVGGYDAGTHIQAIRGLVDAGCAALCVSTVDVPEIRAYISEIGGAGIPVVAVNTDISDSERLCYVGCDYLKCGDTAAGLFALIAPERMELLIVTGSLKVKGHNDRIRGFSRTLRQKGIPYRLVDIVESQDSDETAYHAAMRAFRENPQINCVYIAAAGAAGVCSAIAECGLQAGIRVAAHDEIEGTKRLLRQGAIDFTIGQEPEEQGYRAIELLFKYFMGNRRTVPDNHITGTIIKIKENIDDA